MEEKERLNKNKNKKDDHDPETKRPIDPRRVLQILEYRRKTMTFVESMLKSDISLDHLKAGEEFLCQRDYDDIAQERYLIKLCGYPLCSNQITKEWKQKYHISLRDKKIYDVETRKLYCSVECMNTSTSYRNENLSEQPVWMRMAEDFLKSSGHKDTTLEDIFK